MTPAATIIVPTHAGAHRLPALLQALEQQTTRHDWDMIVVVDGVVDDTPALLETWADRLPLSSHVLETNRGRAHALNTGYDEAAGRVLIRCDDDLTPRPEFVDRHVHWHAERDDLGVIGLTRDVHRPTAYAATYGEVAGGRARADAYAAAPADRWRHWAANNSLVRTVWQQSGRFDERFTFGEDFELGWRLAAAGIELVIDPELETEHRGPAPDAATRAARAFVSGAAHGYFDHVHGRAAALDGARVNGTTDVTAKVATRAPAKVRLWNGIVGALATVERDTDRAARAGRAVDRVLPYVPKAIGRSLVAAVVEAAGRSGRESDLGSLASAGAQRAREIAAERSRHDKAATA